MGLILQKLRGQIHGACASDIHALVAGLQYQPHFKILIPMSRIATSTALDKSRIHSTVHRLCELWGIEQIENEIQVEFSTRMTRSLGRTQPHKRVIRLNSKLCSSLSGYLEEVLCHELAHIATVYKYGGSPLPHGKEWQSLVRMAGYEPSVRMQIDSDFPPKNHLKRFRHQCPVCHSVRVARVPMKRWRCSECVASGLSGELEVEELG